MEIVEHRQGNFLISTDKSRLQPEVIQDFLSRESYWAQGRPLSTVEKTIETSLCFGVYDGHKQVGFARVVTDYATFAWLCDVFVITSHRGRGLAKWLVEIVVAHPNLQGLRLFMLATSDAHDLYHKYGGFEALEVPNKWMGKSSGP